MINNSNSKKGFTIIEVVLVLAIAGLIFLMVFIALPALRRSTNDTQRRSDASTFMSQMTQYQTNNRGQVVGSALGLAAFLTDYMKQTPLPGTPTEFVDPKSGTNYAVTYINTAPTTVGSMSYRNNYVCSGEAMTATGATARSAALLVKLEGSGIFCVDNQD